MKNKIGNYVSQLMTTVVDTNSTDFVKQLALDELNKINIDIGDFVKKHSVSTEVEEIKKTQKVLLQEEKNAK